MSDSAGLILKSKTMNSDENINTQGMKTDDAKEPHDERIIASLLPEDDKGGRLWFLPKYFGEKLYIRGESLIYARMQRLCREYKGGYWNFYELSNGGFYMAPADDCRFQLECHLGNGFSREVSADAAGIIVTLFVLGQLLEETLDGCIRGLYDALRDFAGQHVERAMIFAAID